MKPDADHDGVGTAEDCSQGGGVGTQAVVTVTWDVIVMITVDSGVGVEVATLVVVTSGIYT